MRPIYDEIGLDYAIGRQPEPRWATAIDDALGDARTLINVGAGTGSYEPRDRRVVAVEPSTVMIAQRPAGAAPVIMGVAERLPFRDHSFDAALAVLTMHHWTDWRAGLAGLQRISRRQLIFTFDSSYQSEFWLVKDYIPEIRFPAPSLTETVEALPGSAVVSLPVPADCVDGVLCAHWRRPHAYLDERVRRNASILAQTDQKAVARGVARLAADLRTGAWHRRYTDLLQQDAIDCGYRLIVAENP